MYAGTASPGALRMNSLVGRRNCEKNEFWLLANGVWRLLYGIERRGDTLFSMPNVEYRKHIGDKKQCVISSD